MTKEEKLEKSIADLTMARMVLCILLNETDQATMKITGCLTWQEFCRMKAEAQRRIDAM